MTILGCYRTSVIFFVPVNSPASMMSASWMGSHFTNDDLVKESRMTEDYTFEITYEGEKEGEEVIEITCRPKVEAAVVWGEIVVTVRRKDLLPLEMKYYDEDLALARTLTFSEFTRLGGRRLPVVPAYKPDESTEVRYQQIEFDVPIGNDFFSLRNLRRWGGRWWGRVEG